MTSKEVKLNGLVLAGGKSTRMGHDKSVIDWHGKEQKYYLADLLKQHCDEVFISCREDQVRDIDGSYKTIADKFTDAGPSTGILSALSQDEHAAWIVIACDLPLIDEQTLNNLIVQRAIDKVATTYKSPHDGLPEPLITIWEPKSKEVLLSFKEKGYSCPRKALINSDTKIIESANPEALINANTPEDAKHVRTIIANKSKAV